MQRLWPTELTANFIQVPEKDKEKVEKATEEEAKKRVGVTEKTLDEAKEAIKKQGQRRGYRIEYFDDPNGAFFELSGSRATSWSRKWNRRTPSTRPFMPRCSTSKGAPGPGTRLTLCFSCAGEGRTADRRSVTQTLEREPCKKQWSPFLSNALKVLEQTAHAGRLA